MKDKIKIWKLFVTILFKIFLERKPPDDIVVKARLNESKNLIPVKLYKRIIMKVVSKYITKILINFGKKLLKKFTSRLLSGIR